MLEDMLVMLEQKITTAIDKIQLLNLKVQQLESENSALKAEIQFYYEYIQKLIQQDQALCTSP